MGDLAPEQRERLLTACECGHTINDHGSLVACWRCEDEGGECSTPFETLLAARIEAALAEARAEGAREALLEAADEAAAHAVSCPEGCNTSRCAEDNRVTERWLRDRAEQTGGLA